MIRAIKSGETRTEYARWFIPEYNKLPPLTKDGNPREECKYKEIDGVILARCSTCREYLPLELFRESKKQILHHCCTPCDKIREAKRRDENRDKIRKQALDCYYKNHEKRKKKGLERSRAQRRQEGKPERKQSRYEEIDGKIHRLCTCCDKMLTLDHFSKSGETHHSQCRSCVSPKKREWKKSNRGRTNANSRRLYQESREFRLVCAIRGRIAKAVKELKMKKVNKSLDMLGCSLSQLAAHIESRFAAGMSWENHGIYTKEGPMTWHVDHIKPISSFDLTDPEQQRECFHYTNLQPLWATENLSKGDNVNWQLNQATAS